MVINKIYCREKKMLSDQNETVLEDIKPILQLNRPLLPIEKYAVREGVTRRVVEEYGRLGIIQIRKYKGKTYVVDVPLSPYLLESGELRSLQESCKMDDPAIEKHNQQVNKTSHAQMISELVPPALQTSTSKPLKPRAGTVEPAQAQKVIHGINKITGKTMKPNVENTKTEKGSIRTKDLFNKASEVSSKLIGKNKSEFCSSKSVSNSTAVSYADRRQTDSDIEQDGVRRKWQIATVLFMMCFFAAFLGCLWLFMNQRVHSGRLDQATASIQNVYDDFIQTNQQLSTLQGKLVEFTAEIELVKQELSNSKTESESVRNDLTQIKRSLDTIQQYNNAALGQFREQLQQITTRLSKVIKNPETSSDINAPGK
ncbi:MAG: hypothetical protein A2167_00060 [Planctomycetes bacterium RBG_13_46_10]|nr:MAG: hypothetical protein A2167_00060 [Planctomycetes bacterium RBG_13_46_10]